MSRPADYLRNDENKYYRSLKFEELQTHINTSDGAIYNDLSGLHSFDKARQLIALWNLIEFGKKVKLMLKKEQKVIDQIFYV